MRDLADVSMNLQPKFRARVWPSEQTRGLAKGGTILRRERLVARTLCRHLPLAIEIALVTDDNHGEVVLVLDPEDLLLECHDLLEALPVGYRVDEQEALSCAHVLLAHGRVLLLSSCVEHIEQRNLIVNDALLAVRVWPS